MDQIVMNEQELESNSNAPDWARKAIQTAIPRLKMELSDYNAEYNECISGNDVNRMRRLLSNPIYEKYLHSLSTDKL